MSKLNQIVLKICFSGLLSASIGFAHASPLTTQPTNDNSHPRSCEEQLVFPIEQITALQASPTGFVVLAPIGSPESRHSMKNILKRESLNLDFHGLTGPSALSQLLEEEGGPKNLLVRVPQLRPLITGQIQLALYEGKIEKFKRHSSNLATLTLAKGNQRVELRIQMTDELYVRYLPNP